MTDVLYSFYSPVNYRLAYTGFLDEYAVLPYTDVLYNVELGYLKPVFDINNNIWVESATEGELDLIKIPEETLLAELCNKYKIPFLKDTEIQYDILHFLKPKEAVYGLKGAKLYKDYVYLEDGEEQIIVRQEYNINSELRTYSGFTATAITGLNKNILFFKKTEPPLTKQMSTLDFNVMPIITQNPINDKFFLLYSSSKLEEFLENQRYKADNMLKSFNPNLYNWLYSAYGDLYQGYLKTGNSHLLINAFQNESNSFNLNILNKIVEEQFLVIILGEMETYPNITVKDLIIMNLQQ